MRAPRALRPYLAFFRRALAAHLEYSSSLGLNLLATAAGYSLTVLVWRGALGARAGAGLYAYLALAFCVHFSLSVAFERYVGERIREGLIATDLLKPVDYTWFFLWQALSDVCIQGLFALGVLAAAAVALRGALAPATPLAAAEGALSLVLAFLVQFHLGFGFVQLIFATHSNYGPFHTRMFLHTAFSGLFAPLDAYPPALRAVADALPFRHVVYTPCAIWLGRLGEAEALRALGEQAAWALALTLFTRATFGALRRQLTIQGG